MSRTEYEKVEKVYNVIVEEMRETNRYIKKLRARKNTLEARLMKMRFMERVNNRLTQ